MCVKYLKFSCASEGNSKRYSIPSIINLYMARITLIFYCNKAWFTLRRETLFIFDNRYVETTTYSICNVGTLERTRIIYQPRTWKSNDTIVNERVPNFLQINVYNIVQELLTKILLQTHDMATHECISTLKYTSLSASFPRLRVQTAKCLIQTTATLQSTSTQRHSKLASQSSMFWIRRVVSFHFNCKVWLT